MITFLVLGKCLGKIERLKKSENFLRGKKVGTLELVLRICNRMRQEVVQDSVHNEY